MNVSVGERWCIVCIILRNSVAPPTNYEGNDNMVVGSASPCHKAENFCGRS